MTNDLFENLLYEEEGATIDFKREQYRFAKASDDEKSELAKDILGFANAWRRTKAYILVGVEEVRGGKSNVVGISASEHLDDHALQQFMNYLVNTPVRFNYRAFSYEGKQVGIFVIDEDQQRPIHLTRNYGKLAKNEVYVRRGSSTDPNKPASPTEIAQMGVGRPRERAELLVEFAEVEKDDAIGTRLEMTCEFCSIPARDDIPRLSDQQDPFGLGNRDYSQIHNSNYYRELAEYEFLTRLCRAARLTVKNVGVVPANNVRVELVVPTGIGILPRLKVPYKPVRSRCGARWWDREPSRISAPFSAVSPALLPLMATRTGSASRSTARTCNQDDASGQTSSTSAQRKPTTTPLTAKCSRTTSPPHNRSP
jgi:hypothetical protein